MEEIDAFLAKHGIGFEKFEHEPVFTVEEAKQQTGHLPGGHVKNLFLRNKTASRYYLLVVHESKRVDLNALAKALNESKLSFGSPEKLAEMLDTTPGSVSPLGLVFDRHGQVTLLFDEDLWQYPILYFHPNRNTASYGLTPEGVRLFFKACGHLCRSLGVPLRP